MVTLMKNVIDLQTAKAEPRGVTLHLLDSLPISAWRCLLDYMKSSSSEMFKSNRQAVP